jgi:hypothetical protein
MGVDVENLGIMLFSIQKYMILETRLNSQSVPPRIPDADAYAWYVGLYPLFSKSNWHEPVKDFFDISAEKVFRVIKYLDDEWMERKYHTFYEVQRHFKSKEKDLDVDKWDLICILQYALFCERFDEKFWDKILQSGDSPVEASYIKKNFDIKDIRLG